jgi:hypothetical protein
MQNPVDGQETPLAKMAYGAGCGLGMGSACQAWPFQPAATEVRPGPVPTAWQ